MRLLAIGTTIFSVLGVAAATNATAVFHDLHLMNCGLREGEYLKMPEHKQNAYWIGRFEHYKAAWSSLLNKTQLEVADRAIALAYMSKREDKKAEVSAVRDEFTSHFGGEATRDMFTSFKDMEPPNSEEQSQDQAPSRRDHGVEVEMMKRTSETDPSPKCGCTTQDAYCWGGNFQPGSTCYLNGQSCVGSGGVAACGTMYLFECDGYCYLE